MNKFFKLFVWIKSRDFFVKRRRSRYSRIIVDGNPAGYYIESIKGMCAIWQDNMERGTVSKEYMESIIPKLEAARKVYYYEDAHEAIDKCLQAIHDYVSE